MKTQRRHELQKNDLSAALTSWVEAIEPYSRAIIAGALALTVGGFAWFYMSNQSKQNQEAGWDAYYMAIGQMDPRDSLAKVAADYSGTPVSVWARVVLADIDARDGSEQLLSNRAVATEKLNRAVGRYTELLKESRDAAILERATIGLARTKESLGNLDDARKYYREVSEKWPKGLYADMASQRAKDLEEPRTKGFYDWLASYKPPNPARGLPGVPGMRPDDLFDSLKGIDLTIPKGIEDAGPVPQLPLLDGEKSSSNKGPGKDDSPLAIPPMFQLPGEGKTDEGKPDAGQPVVPDPAAPPEAAPGDAPALPGPALPAEPASN